MPNEQPEPKSKPLRLRPQFSLQTMLVLMLVAALVCAWLLAPRLRERIIGGGALKVRAAWSDADLSVNSTLLDARTPAPNGRWILYDGYGGKRIEGSIAAGAARGRWRYFNEEGREMMAGDARHGRTNGTWTARHANGRVSHQVTYRQQDAVRITWTGTAHETRGWFSLRTGPAQQHWQDGRPRVRGQFANDRREGTWTFFDRDGQEIAEGTYRQGKKHGKWSTSAAREKSGSPTEPVPSSQDPATGPNRAATGETPVTQWFFSGKKVDDLDDLLARFSRELLGDDPLQQVRSARHLERFGPQAVPALREIFGAGNDAQRLLAIRTLKHLGPQAATATDDLAALGHGEHSHVQLNALVALAEVDPQQTEKIFRRLLAAAASDHRDDRDLVIECLAQAGAAGLRQLTAGLDSPEPAVRLAAFDTVARMYFRYCPDPPVRGDPHVDADLIEVLIHRAADHSDPKIRKRGELIEQLKQAPWNWSQPSGGMGGGGMF